MNTDIGSPIFNDLGTGTRDVSNGQVEMSSVSADFIITTDAAVAATQTTSSVQSSGTQRLCFRSLSCGHIHPTQLHQETNSPKSTSN